MPRARRPEIPYDLILVEWVDSVTPIDGWQWVRDRLPAKPIKCVSVGFQIEKTKEVLSIAPNIGDEGSSNTQVCGVIEIPISAIRKVTRL